MEYYGKEKRLYHGIWAPLILIIVIPVALFFFFKAVFLRFASYDIYPLNNMSLGFAGLVTSLFGISCLLSGIFYDLFKAMINRIKETLEFFDFGSKEAFSWYFYEFVREGGIILWTFILFTIANIVMTIIGFFNYFNWYFLNK